MQSRLNNFENTVPKPFVPNLKGNTWRPVALHPLLATRPPEPLSNFRCTNIDETSKTATAFLPPPPLPQSSSSPPPSLVLQLNKPAVSLPVQALSAVFGRTSNVSTHLNAVLKPQRKTVAQPAVPNQPGDDPSQLRDQLSRLLSDRQKLIQTQHPPNNAGQKSQTPVIQPQRRVHAANSFQKKPIVHGLATFNGVTNSSQNVLHVPTTAAKFGGGHGSGSTSPLSSVGSIGSTGSGGSISPQSSASGARLASALETTNRRRPSPLYQNSSEADVDYLTNLLVKGLNSKPKADNLQTSPPTANAGYGKCFCFRFWLS